MDEEVKIEDYKETEKVKKARKKREEKVEEPEAVKKQSIEWDKSITIELEVSFGSPAQEELLMPILQSSINSFREAAHRLHKKNRVVIRLGQKHEVQSL